MSGSESESMQEFGRKVYFESFSAIAEYARYKRQAN